MKINFLIDCTVSDFICCCLLPSTTQNAYTQKLEYALNGNIKEVTDYTKEWRFITLILRVLNDS
ncbi:MAG: hypothetical protein GX159_07795 [Flavobacteriaceae bacterium]|jgi:hypothetical protein|nr:hypothetical protein [Flavobacteriaceae bacterium]